MQNFIFEEKKKKMEKIGKKCSTMKYNSISQCQAKSMFTVRAPCIISALDIPHWCCIGHCNRIFFMKTFGPNKVVWNNSKKKQRNNIIIRFAAKHKIPNIPITKYSHRRENCSMYSRKNCIFACRGRSIKISVDRASHRPSSNVQFLWVCVCFFFFFFSKLNSFAIFVMTHTRRNMNDSRAIAVRGSESVYRHDANIYVEFAHIWMKQRKTNENMVQT